MDILFSLHLFSTFFLTGLIWVIQLVHYPSFLYIDEKNFPSFESFHTKSISLIVLPTMIFELISGAYLYIVKPNTEYDIFLFSLLILIWFSTFFLSVPLHGKLSIKKDIKVINRLIYTNWPRTIFWSLRSILLILTILEK